MARTHVAIACLLIALAFLYVVEVKVDSLSWRNKGTSGSYSTECASQHQLAVLFPFRGVFDEMIELVPALHSFLIHQCVRHKFYVINQADTFRFNKGSLINIGYILSKNECDYLAIHDIDLLPLNPEIKYFYPENGPLHVASPEYHPFLDGTKYVGGILVLTMDQYKQVNGMTNTIWGWGGEDNEFYMRMLGKNMTIFRQSGLSTGKKNTFKNLHNPLRRPRDKKRFHKEKADVFHVEPNTGFHNVKYNLTSIVEMTIESCPVTIYSVELKCDISTEKWCSYDS